MSDFLRSRPFCLAGLFPKLAVGLFFASISGLSAFPPAPFYNLYGTVRDQVGQPLQAEGAVLILFKGTTVAGRTPITPGTRLDQNYDLNVRLDQNRSGTTLYTEKAVATQGIFHLAVELNGVLFYPIEAAGTLRAGNGGERVRLDLTLGEDTDRDGLPDAWEQWQLYQSGRFPDASGHWTIELLDRNGDFDGDGRSNFLEYIAGTFAGDATERFDLAIREKTEAQVRFEFYAISGKTYTIERTSDMKVWTAVPFSVGAAAAGALSWQAGEVAIVSAFTASGPAAKDFYRLTVR